MVSKHFTIVKRGVFYFQRRVPKRLRHHYASDFIVTSLKTRDEKAAKKAARQLALQLDSYWLQLAFQERYTTGMSLPASSRRTRAPQEAMPTGDMTTSQDHALSPRLSDVKAIYLKNIGGDRGKSFYLAVERAFGYLHDAKGDANISEITRADVNALRDRLIAGGMSPQSVRRSFVPLRAAFTVALSELDLQLPNVFRNVLIKPAQSVHTRQPFDTTTISHIQRLCLQDNSSNTRLMALISDTGMRLAEAVGLRIHDIKLEADVPHIELIAHPWRRLKTPSSTRKIPLVGCALWAAEEIVKTQRIDCDFAFPAYCNETKCNAHSASARLNFWLRKYITTKGLVVHSFRHSMRDRLRAVECPTDMVDQIGGWSSTGVGTRYGSGYPLANLHEWMQRTVLLTQDARQNAQLALGLDL